MPMPDGWTPGPGHCAYYHRGGVPLTPEAIKSEVSRGDYRGAYAYRIDDIEAMKNTARARGLIAEMRAEAQGELKRDLARYAEVQRELEAFRAFIGPHSPYSAEMMYRDPRTACMLKHNHLLNDYATLRALDAAEAKIADPQLSLF